MAYRPPGKKRPKRPQYCPEMAESIAKRRRNESLLHAQLKEMVATASTVKALLLSDTVLSAGLSSAEVELLLVTALGLQGLLRMQEALAAVPPNLPDRASLVFLMIREHITDITEAKCKRCIQLMETCLRDTAAEGSSSALSHGDTCHRLLSPPVSTCINPECRLQGTNDALIKHHDPITVTVYTLLGPEVARKHTLKCKGCSFIYNYCMYGRKTTEGEQYYNIERDVLEVSDMMYCEKLLYELFSSLSLHCWVSFTGFAEAYYDYCRNLPKQRLFNQFWQGRQGTKPQLSRKVVSDMFYSGELEKEMRDANHPGRLQWKFQLNSDRLKYMALIVEEQNQQLYPHAQTASCPKIGCGRCWSMDGNWKLCFPHCMFPVTCSVPSMPMVRLPNVCPEQLKPKSAFCVEHYPKAQALGYPTTVKGFLSYCGSAPSRGKLMVMDEFDEAGSSSDEDGENMVERDIEPDEGEEAEIDEAYKKLASSCTVVSGSDAVFDSQGTSDFVKQFPSVVQLFVPDIDPSTEKPKCRKDLGEKRKLRLWSRGHVFLVRPCGHIDFWKPIYRSESPYQVLLIVVAWLYKVLQDIPEAEWSSVVLSYDNMCHLDSLRAVAGPLPLPQPYDTMWSKITKVIDYLHIRNHRDEACQRKYNPKEIREKHPKYNLMIAEQTFSWLSRYKKIVCSMDKMHHLFFLHRTVAKRNDYSQVCAREGRKILLPKLKAPKE